MRTFSPKASDIQRAWHVVDAEGLVLGRLATEVARVLRGKHKPIFAPHLDTGDHVIVVNAAKVVLTADKAEKKIVYRHSGYPGGLKTADLRRAARPASPRRPCARTIRGMLPKNRLGRQMLKKLKVYAGPAHPHAAQQPAAARRRRTPGAAHEPRGRSVPKPLIQTTGRRKQAVARVRLRAGSGTDHDQPAGRRRLLPVRDAPHDPHRAAAAHRDRRASTTSTPRSTAAASPARPAPCASASPGRSSSSTPSCGPRSRRPASSPATPARRSRRSTASRRPARLRSTPSARSRPPP